MRIAKIPIYEFSDLSEKVKQRVLDKKRNENDFPFLSEDLKYKLEELLTENRIEEIVKDSLKLYYSLSNCQVDDACFVGTFKWQKYKIVIKHSSHYYHYNSTNIYVELLEPYDDNGDDIEFPYTKEKEVYNEFKAIYDNICKDLESTGYDIIDTESTDEYIIENIKSNNYEFFEDGEIFYLTEEEPTPTIDAYNIEENKKHLIDRSIVTREDGSIDYKLLIEKVNELGAKRQKEEEKLHPKYKT